MAKRALNYCGLILNLLLVLSYGSGLLIAHSEGSLLLFHFVNWHNIVTRVGRYIFLKLASPAEFVHFLFDLI